MRYYARVVREEQKYGSSQNHDLTMVLDTDRGEPCNCGLFVFSSTVRLRIPKLFFIIRSLNSKKGEDSID